MQFSEIGQQLRAYRMESGLKAEEIAARLGVSRAALYRYEKGEVIKLDTVKRLAELLKISPLTLLGIGVEYYSRPIGFLERLRQMEESADQILHIGETLCYLTTTDYYDATIAQIFEEIASQSAADRTKVEATSEHVLTALKTRKQMFAVRRPSVITVMSTGPLQRLLRNGIGGVLVLSERLRAQCRDVARREVERMADLMESEPIGLQIGVNTSTEVSSQFILLRNGARASLAINPFPTDCLPNNQTGVAMITSAEDAINAHQRVAEQAWRDAAKGTAAAQLIRKMLVDV